MHEKIMKEKVVSYHSYLTFSQPPLSPSDSSARTFSPSYISTLALGGEGPKIKAPLFMHLFNYITILRYHAHTHML